MTPDTYYDRIFVINIDRRTDRWAQCVDEFAKYGITKYERWPGSLGFNDDGTPHGNKGCTLSHRTLLRHIADRSWGEGGSGGRDFCALVLEDDFKIHIQHLGGAVSRELFEREFNYVIDAVPDDWDMTYIGGHYGSKPLARMNPSCIKVNTMLTTSSYGITAKFAKVLSHHMEESARSIDAANPENAYLGPIDSVLSGYLPHYNCYCVQPRLMIQRPSVSDLTGKPENYLFCMTDPNHEAMV